MATSLLSRNSPSSSDGSFKRDKKRSFCCGRRKSSDFMPGKRKLEVLHTEDVESVLNKGRISSCQDEIERSGLLSLPFDVLVDIVCHLCHDELEPLSRVSRRLREAVFAAKTMHFDYATPNKTRKPPKNKLLVSPLKRFSGSSDEPEKEVHIGSSDRPKTPNAPKLARKTRKSCFSTQDIRDLRVVKLFSALRVTQLPEHTREHNNVLSTNRALFVNDDFHGDLPLEMI